MNHATRCIILLLVVVLPGCTLNLNQESGNVITETREVSGFRDVSFNGTGTLTITQGERESLTITTSDTIMPSIVTEVNDERLTIRFRDTVLSTESITFDLTVNEINRLDVAGAGTIEAVDITTDEFSLDLSGAADITIRDLTADDLLIDVSGAGSVGASGQVQRQEIRLSGLGEYNAFDLESTSASVDVNGAGGADLWTHETLDVQISGAGEVNYYGTPSVTSDISGIGNLHKLGEKPESEDTEGEPGGESSATPQAR